MPIKLVVLSGTLEHKISLHPGEHTFGRNTLLNCKDKRISRQHGSLQVNKDSVVLKALHHNPCFFKNGGSAKTNILTLHNTVTLYSGDRFGLLPESDWYEVLYLPGDDEIVNKELSMQDDTEHQKENADSTICNDAAEETHVVDTHNNRNSRTTNSSDISNNQDELQNNQEELSAIHPENHVHPKNQEDRSDKLQPTKENYNGNRNLVKDTENNTSETQEIQGDDIGASDVPIETNENENGSNEGAHSSKDNSNDPSDVLQDENVTEDGTNQNPHLKRPNSTDGNDEAKKIKLEPEVKKEPEDVKPSSSDQANYTAYKAWVNTKMKAINKIIAGVMGHNSGEQRPFEEARQMPFMGEDGLVNEQQMSVQEMLMNMGRQLTQAHNKIAMAFESMAADGQRIATASENIARTLSTLRDIPKRN